METIQPDFSSGRAQPSAVLARLIGWVSAPMPLGPAQVGLARLGRRLTERHPELADRLGAFAGSVIAIEPEELAFHLVVRIERSGLALALARKNGSAATTSIRGPLTVLAAMLSGSLDGDAAFFARDLTIEGDTGAIVALRNAIDGAEIDFVEECLATFGPTAPLLRRAGTALLRIDAALSAHAARLRADMLAPVVARLDAVEPEMARCSRRLDDLAGKSGACARAVKV